MIYQMVLILDRSSGVSMLPQERAIVDAVMIRITATDVAGPTVDGAVQCPYRCKTGPRFHRCLLPHLPCRRSPPRFWTIATTRCYRSALLPTPRTTWHSRRMQSARMDPAGTRRLQLVRPALANEAALRLQAPRRGVASDALPARSPVSSRSRSPRGELCLSRGV